MFRLSLRLRHMFIKFFGYNSIHLVQTSQSEQPDIFLMMGLFVQPAERIAAQLGVQGADELGSKLQWGHFIQRPSLAGSTQRCLGSLIHQ